MLINFFIGACGAIGIFCISFMCTYWSLAPAITFPVPKSRVTNQIEGSSVAVDVPLRDYVSLATGLSISTKIMDIDGRVVQRTSFVVPSPNDHYKVITYSKLPVGVFNIVLQLEYKSNPLKWQLTEVPLGVLNVISRG